MSVDHKVLLLTHNLAHFAGAEINILQLARAFRERGWNVEIGAFVYGNPIKEIFGKEGFNVSNVLHEDPSRKEYDLIWAQHAPVLNQVIFNKKIKSKKIIYSSLSPIEPLESAPIYINNLSLCLANSQETAKSLIQQGVKRSILQIFVNSVDEEFFKAYQQNRGKHLGKIAIVSNHVPSELGEAGALLRDEGYEVACFGYGKEFKFITPEILSNFDAVVTIGKTVQFSLAMGIPVYCYDHFGGPGWISKENFDTAGYYNFRTWFQ